MKSYTFLVLAMLLVGCVSTLATASEGSIQTEESIMKPTILLGNIFCQSSRLKTLLYLERFTRN